MTETKIIILMPYFGKLPRWHQFFFLTCQHNRFIDWHFFADFDPPEKLPNNVKFTRLDLNEFKMLVEKKLGFPVELPYPFKVCDFRPAFGEIFSDFIIGYNYWCWGDSDVVYGDLLGIFENYKLSKYDIISVRSEFLSGELCFLRNCKLVNELYRDSKDFKKVFTTPKGFDFEELGFFGSNDRTRKIVSFTEVAFSAHLKGKIRMFLYDLGHNDRKNKAKNLSLYWEQGRLWDLETGAESMLYHFLDSKKRGSFFVPEEVSDLYLSGFSVNSEGFEINPRERRHNVKLMNYVIDIFKKRVRRRRAWARLKQRVLR